MMMMMMMKSIGMVVLLGGTAQVIGTSQGIPDNAPSTYVDDIYHCLDPKDVDGQYFISCNPNTFLWETKELTTDLPLICAQHFNSRGEDLPTVRTNIIDGGDDNDNDINIPDHLEPCILWTMRSIFPRYLEEEQSSSKNNNTDEEEVPVPDDWYHCKNPNATFYPITCDPDTYEWKLDELVVDQPPPECGGPDFVILPNDLSNIQDWYEPCVHWAMMYGNLAPTSAPSVFVVPPPPSLDLVNTVVLEPLLVKLIWAEGVLPKNFSIDREGLRDITERHLLDSLTGSLGPNLIASVDILLSSDYTSDDTSWTEVFTGTVTRTEGSGIPSFTILGLVEEAIQGENLEIYEFRLKVSEYSRFRVVQSVQITTLSGGGGGGNNDESVEEDEEDRKWSKQLLILVCASGSLGLVAACSLLYCVYYCATQRATRLAEEKAKAAIATSGTELYIPSSSYKSSVASGSKQSNKSKISIQNIPLVKDTAKALGDALPRDEERSTSDDDNTMSLISMSAFGDDENPKYQFKPSHRSLPKDYAATAGLGGGLEKHRDEEGQEVMMMAQNTMLGAHFDADEDSHSVGTSVYSYFNQTGMDNQSVTTNDDTFLGSIIRRGTGLHDDDSVSRSSPPLYRPNPFSVMDTITKFVVSPRRKSSSSAKSSSVDIKMDGRGVEPSERITAINILPSSGSDFNGSITDYEDNETYAYGDVENPNHFESMYHEGQDGLTSFSHHANETASSNDDVADSGSEVGTMTSFYTNTDGPDVPVKERLESMWASEDAAYAAVELQQPQEDVKEPVVVKEVEEKEIEVENEGTGRIKVFQDDGSDRNSGSANAQGLLTSYESDDSPPVSILQQSKPVVPAPIPTMKIVNVTPTDAMCDESVGDDEDNGMALRLPNQLKGADLHHDNMSQSSSISSRSGRSSRSAAALRNNVFGAASLKAQANALLQKQQGMKQNDGEDGSVKSSDSALYRSLLSQDDTNDAGLFAKTPTNEGRRIPSSVRPKPQLSNLIRSFDQVWAKEEKSGIEQPKPVERERNDVDSDEDDLYLEGNEDGSEEDAYQSDNDSVKSGASRAVQQLSSMLSMPVVSVLDMKNEAVEKDPSPTKVMDVPIERFDLERKRSFEIQDPDEDEEEDAGGLDISRDTQDSETSVAMGMERLRRLSLGGYAETMASF